MRFIKGLLFWALLISVFYNYRVELKRWALAQVTRKVEVVKTVEVEKKQKPLEELLNTIPKAYGLKREEVEAVIKIESNFNADAVGLNYGTTSMDVADHGLMQVNGRTAKKRGYTWLQMHVPEHNLEVGCWNWAYCKDKERKLAKNKHELTKLTGACFNGGEKWRDNAPDKKALNIAHGEKIAAELETRMLEKYL